MEYFKSIELNNAFEAWSDNFPESAHWTISPTTSE